MSDYIYQGRKPYRNDMTDRKDRSERIYHVIMEDVAALIKKELALYTPVLKEKKDKKGQLDVDLTLSE